MVTRRGVCCIAILSGLVAPGGMAAQAQITVEGEVLDLLTGVPVLGVEITIPSLDLSTISDSLGYFRLSGIALGVVGVTAHHVGYHDLRGEVPVIEGEVVVIELTPRAIPIPGVSVDGVGQVSERKASGSPWDEITPSDMEELRSRATSVLDVLRAKGPPRLRIVQQGRGKGGIAYCIESTRTRPSVVEVSETAGGCRPSLIAIDGIVVFNPPLSAALDPGGPIELSDLVAARILRMHPEDVQRVRYLSPTQAFFRYGEEGRFGALLIETRAGSG